jgi:hypothetical protein
MARYIVEDGHKLHDGQLYAPGEIIECSEEEAARMRLKAAASEPNGQTGAEPTKAELLERLTELGVCVPKKYTRATLIELLEKVETGRQAADEAAAHTPEVQE